jgi:hypothetical protein
MFARSPMRRTPKGWTKPERKWPVLPESPPVVRAVMAPAVDSAVAIPKDAPVRSEEYRRYVASFPCFACGLQGRSQAAHSDSGRHGKGMALKASDQFLFPLCCSRPLRVGCHEAFDLLLDMDLGDRREAEERYVARMHAQAIADGWDMETLRRKA